VANPHLARLGTSEEEVSKQEAFLPSSYSIAAKGSLLPRHHRRAAWLAEQRQHHHKLIASGARRKSIRLQVS